MERKRERERECDPPGKGNDQITCTLQRASEQSGEQTLETDCNGVTKWGNTGLRGEMLPDFLVKTATGLVPWH